MERPIFDRLIHIPGPNPILTPGKPGDWDDHVIEACNVFKDQHTYYLYYHGVPQYHEKWGTGGYRLGAATASHPLGPWTKHGNAPVIDVGPVGSWESKHVACAAVVKEGESDFYLWYSGYTEGGKWSVGLATANGPLGPWTKYDRNPIIEDFGYIGAVVKVDGKYCMYVEHPIGSTSFDQGPFCLAAADRPEGPWIRYESNPVLSPGDSGAWDDGGFSEAGMLCHEGVFHTFYGGTKARKLESIGYAWSTDGLHFHRHPCNPVVLRERCPDTSALAEVHALFEPPLFYLYHTVRYVSVTEWAEDIGVQILATSRPFRFDMPVLTLDRLDPGAITPLETCPPIGIENTDRFALTVECNHADQAKRGLRVHLFHSANGLEYDTEPLHSFNNHFRHGQLSRKTAAFDSATRFVKVALENKDEMCAATDVRVVATLSGA